MKKNKIPYIFGITKIFENNDSKNNINQYNDNV